MGREAVRLKEGHKQHVRKGDGQCDSVLSEGLLGEERTFASSRGLWGDGAKGSLCEKRQ